MRRRWRRWKRRLRAAILALRGRPPVRRYGAFMFVRGCDPEDEA